MAVTPEAAGSSPVDPANYPSENRQVPVQRGSLLANGPESAEQACLRAEFELDFHNISSRRMPLTSKEMLVASSSAFLSEINVLRRRGGSTGDREISDGRLEQDGRRRAVRGSVVSRSAERLGAAEDRP